jgi:hypothetical protein
MKHSNGITFLTLAGTTGNIEVPVQTEDVHGEWAAHRNPDGRAWRVSHVPTGRSIASLADDMTYRDARRIVRLLDRALPTLDVEIDDRNYAVVAADDGRIVEAIVAEVVGS